jgi:hypothetical protein
LLGLLQKLRPDHQTSATLRTHTLAPLRQGCRTCTRLGKKLDLVGAELVAIDGSQCSAVNANERTCTPATRAIAATTRRRAHRSAGGQDRRAQAAETAR